MKVTYKQSIYVKGAVTDFGLGPGVISTRTVTFTGTEKELNSPRFIASLLSNEDDFLKSELAVKSERVEE